MRYHIGQPLKAFKSAQHELDAASLGAQTIRAKQYGNRPRACKFDKYEIATMLQLEVLELGQMKWALQVLYTLKKENKLQFCVDYSKGSVATVGNSYHIPRTDIWIDVLRQDYISSIGCRQQLQKEQEDQMIWRFNYIWVKSWTITIPSYVIHNKERAKHNPICSGRHPIYGPLADLGGIPRRYNDIFEDCWGSYLTRKTRHEAT